MLSASCRCSIAKSRRRGRPPPMAAMPAATISNRPRQRGVRDVAFRAGIEAGMAYIWSAVVVHYLMLIARLKSP
jgi:hypothetical protein